MELKSVLWRYSAKKISFFFALNLQSYWLMFADFGNICRFLKFDQVRKDFSEKLSSTKNFPEFLEPCDKFWLKKYFELR